MPIHSSTLAWRICLHDKSHIHDTLRARVQAGQLVLRWTKGYCTWFFYYIEAYSFYTQFFEGLYFAKAFSTPIEMLVWFFIFHSITVVNWSESHSVVSSLLRPHGILQARISGMGTSPGDLPNPEIELRSPTLQADSSPAEPQGKSIAVVVCIHWFAILNHSCIPGINHWIILYYPCHT